jgi:guanylate kinase
MDAAREEISHYKEFDYIIINEDFDMALTEIKTIITATNLGRCRQSAFYDDFVSKIMNQED